MYTQKKIYTHGTPIVHTTNQLYTWRSMCAHIEVSASWDVVLLSYMQHTYMSIQLYSRL